MARKRPPTLGNFAKASANFSFKGMRAIYRTGYALKGLIEFDHIQRNKKFYKYGLPSTVYYSAGAVADLYSAVFTSAGTLIGRPRLGGASLAAAALMSGTLAYDQGYLDNIQSVFNWNNWTITDNRPKVIKRDDEYFSDKRTIDYSRLTQSNYLFNPDMVSAYRSSTKVRGYVDLIIAEAKKNDINPVLLANQLFQESWQFKDSVVEGRKTSGKGAVGISQFLPSTAKRLYNVSADDLKDWKKAIPLAAKHMGILTKKYNGDQLLAMVAYNAGDEAESHRENPILFVQKKLEQTTITGTEWMQYMDERRDDVNRKIYSGNAWHNETFKYIAIITGASWSEETIKIAQNLNSQLKLASIYFKINTPEEVFTAKIGPLSGTPALKIVA